MDQAANETLYKTGTSHEDNFYDTIETTSPDYATKTAEEQKPLDPEAAAVKRKEMEEELAKLEEEIVTLRTVLSAKLNQAGELRRKLGTSPIDEFKSDFTNRFQNLKQSDAIQKTGNVLKSLSAFASRKMSDVRKSAALKSFGEKVGGAYSTVKTSQSLENIKSKVLGVSASKSETNFNDAVHREPTIAENPAASSVQSGSVTGTQ